MDQSCGVGLAVRYELAIVSERLFKLAVLKREVAK